MLTFVANSKTRESPSVCALGYASKDLATVIFTHFQDNSHFFDCSMDKWHQSALKEWIEKYGNSISQLLSLVILCLGLGFGQVASAQHLIIHNPDQNASASLIATMDNHLICQLQANGYVVILKCLWWR